MNPHIHRPCRVCGRPTSQWCSRCNNAHYCSSEHRNADWENHRGDCRSTPLLIATPPPIVTEVVRVPAILFAADEDRPRMVEIDCRPPHRPSQGLCPIPILQPYFNSVPGQVVITQGLNGEVLRFPLHVFYSASALGIGSPVNHAVHHITSGAASRPWAGNVIALKFSGSRRQGYIAAGSNDLPALSAYFLSY
ncbi:MYND-type domain-containing protein [Mycena indigotica]|uniref:MYND-type domain-containing protein n=1 Tax=Mycena indigotica TaxID=2126181 RepID=A0A8H6WC73_9AGAR|nr:MYND-type domain-containing protein [Mycena indigotica]KAF7309453.1 MYND-type domain-containing protein [Mycena indigotica]